MAAPRGACTPKLRRCWEGGRPNFSWILTFRLSIVSIGNTAERRPAFHQKIFLTPLGKGNIEFGDALVLQGATRGLVGS